MLQEAPAACEPEVEAVGLLRWDRSLSLHHSREQFALFILEIDVIEPGVRHAEGRYQALLVPCRVRGCAPDPRGLKFSRHFSLLKARLRAGGGWILYGQIWKVLRCSPGSRSRVDWGAGPIDSVECRPAKRSAVRCQQGTGTTRLPTMIANCAAYYLQA